MGEEAWRIHTVGAPGLDRIHGFTPLSRAEVATALRLPPAGPWLLVTFHPVTLEYGDTAAHVDELLAALEKVDDATLVVPIRTPTPRPYRQSTGSRAGRPLAPSATRAEPRRPALPLAARAR